MMLDNPYNLKKEGSLRLATESMRLVERVFLGDSGNGERLARKSGQQDIVAGDGVDCDLRNVARDWREGAVVRFVSLLAETVPLRGEHALATDRVEGLSQAANASEQIYEREPTATRTRSCRVTDSKVLDCSSPWACFAAIPPVYGADGVACGLRRFRH